MFCSHRFLPQRSSHILFPLRRSSCYYPFTQPTADYRRTTSEIFNCFVVIFYSDKRTNAMYLMKNLRETECRNFNIVGYKRENWRFMTKQWVVVQTNRSESITMDTSEVDWKKGTSRLCNESQRAAEGWSCQYIMAKKWNMLTVNFPLFKVCRHVLLFGLLAIHLVSFF